MDDVLVFGRSKAEHDERLENVLKRISDAGATLNRDKCSFGQERITFLGHVIDKTGISPDPDKISAILQMKAPSSTTEVCHFMGMVNQLGKFSPQLATISQPLRELLTKKGSMELGPDPREQSKRNLPNHRYLPYTTLRPPTKVSADASSYGLGTVLLQKHHEG